MDLCFSMDPFVFECLFEKFLELGNLLSSGDK